MTRSGMGPWLADIAANVLAITLLVLIALGRLTATDSAPVPADLLTPRMVAPIGGAEAVELLRQRLLPGAPGFVDVMGEPTPLTEGPTVLFLLDPAGYPPTVARLSAQGAAGWLELTVPKALKTPDNQWDPAFLSLAEVADDPKLFRAALQALLVENGRKGAGSGAAALSDDPPQSRLALWFGRALDIMGLIALGAALFGLQRLYRWSVRA